VYLRSRTRISCCSWAGIATVWRYIVASVDASLATLTSADDNCSQATTTVKPRSAPYTKATVVRNGDNVELCSGPTELG
jgi:hypothetical protein